MTERIKIDLDWAGSGERTTGDGGGAVESSIRHDALKQVMLRLVAMPQGTPERDDPYRRRPLALDVMAYRRHDAILVSARRGDGKTTFLADILRLLQQGREAYRKILPDGMTESQIAVLYPLGIVDPTLIETKQNIVVIVIEKIEMAVKRAYRLDESAKKGEYEDFRRVLHELAAGLTLLDGIGDGTLHGKDWADADYVLELGLEKARSAGAFERAFHRYVQTACKFLKADAFVLAMDDVDTAFDRGWPVMEALRKYFATPGLKVIMAGDLRLYNLVVRQQQWKHITKEFFEIESRSPLTHSYADQLTGMIDVLQDQYLVKIVPPENRVELAPLLHFAENPGILFKASKSDPGTQVPAARFIQRYARHLLGIRAAEDRALIRAALLRLPLRSGLQLVFSSWTLVREASPPREVLDNARATALQALGHVASAGAMSLDLPEYELDDPSFSRVFGALSRWLTESGLWLTMSRFHPGGLDEVKDLLSIRIAGRLVSVFRHQPRTLIDFWLRICVVREKLDRGEIAPARSLAETSLSKTNSEPDLRALLDHLNSATTERTTQFVSRLAAWDAGRGRQINRGVRLSGAVVAGSSRLREANTVAFDLYGIRGDTLKRDVFRHVIENGTDQHREEILAALPPPLRGYHAALIKANWSYGSKRGLEAGFLSTFANTLDSLHARLDADARTVAMLPALRLISGQGAENGVYSILRLIAMIAELLEVVDSSDINDDDRVRGLLDTLSVPRTYPTPGVVSDLGQSDDESIDDREDDGNGVEAERADESYEINKMLLAWLGHVRTDLGPFAVAPLTLARAWTRFTYAFDDILSRLTHTRTRYLGVLMHRSIVAFLHAVGVEALRAAGGTLGTKVIDNPIESSFSFLQLLKALDELKTLKDPKAKAPEVEFFWAIFSCPIWGYFLARSELDITGMNDRANATAEVFSRYSKYVEEVINRSPQYEIRFYQNGRFATMDGLYFLLNSIQIQGLEKIRKNVVGVGVDFDNVLTKLKEEFALGEALIVSSSTLKVPATAALKRSRGRPPRESS